MNVIIHISDYAKNKHVVKSGDKKIVVTQNKWFEDVIKNMIGNESKIEKRMSVKQKECFTRCCYECHDIDGGYFYITNDGILEALVKGNYIKVYSNK